LRDTAVSIDCELNRRPRHAVAVRSAASARSRPRASVTVDSNTAYVRMSGTHKETHNGSRLTDVQETGQRHITFKKS
jgi:hypothetical protein